MGTSNASDLERRFTEIEQLAAPACRDQQPLKQLMNLARKMTRHASDRQDIEVLSINWEDAVGFRVQLRNEPKKDTSRWAWLKPSPSHSASQWMSLRIELDTGSIWCKTDEEEDYLPGDLLRPHQIEGTMNRWLHLHGVPVMDRRRPVSRPAAPGSVPRP